MEDTYISNLDIEPGVSLFAIFEGNDGKEVAIFAQKHFVEQLLANKNYLKKDYKQALIDTFLNIDQLLFKPEGQEELKKIKENNEESQAGCTANVALIVGKTVYLANAGNLSAILCRDNAPYELSKDHKPDDEKDKRRIEQAVGFILSPRRNGIKFSQRKDHLPARRALGYQKYKQNQTSSQEEQIIIALLDVKVEEIQANDKLQRFKSLQIWSDGVFEIWNQQQIIDMEILRSNQK
ncbi:unnamed protein product [Paramecium sonneborni]|uniref:protein-serine/threonine phosphatase n=1 Tax=Paramecium sonneborni TaxID=65129 RepID=A0A8S1RBW4_9CILI|nr:unnamed protein product [Paramecium sonneborni]